MLRCCVDRSAGEEVVFPFSSLVNEDNSENADEARTVTPDKLSFPPPGTFDGGAMFSKGHHS